MRITTLNISTSTIIRFVLVILLFIFLLRIFDILILLFASFVMVSAISPLVDKLEKKKIPRPVSTIMIYILIFAGLAFIISLIIPPLIKQIQQFKDQLPIYLEMLKNNSFLGRLDWSADGEAFKFFERSWSFPGGLFTQTKSFFLKFFYVAVFFSLSFYMTIQKNALKRFVKIITPKNHEKYVVSLVSRIQNKMGRWLQGQMILNIIIGVLVYFVLHFIIKVPYAIIIAVVAGALEFILTIGPIISTIFAAAIAFTDSPIKPLFVVIAFIVIQQLENHLIVPIVMKQALGLNPVVIIIALLVGMKLGGPIGAIIAVPFTAALSEFVGDFFDSRRDKS
jgi:predicted PurR-regulated permease PerM